MDRRSAHSNTELGLVVESAPLARELADLIHREQVDVSYSVRQTSKKDGIEWAIPGRQQDLRTTRDPDTGWAQRLGWSLLSSLVNEDYL